MIGTDENTYLKMVALWSITSMPDLRSNMVGDVFKFTCAKGFIANVDAMLFYNLEPVEIVSLLEKAFETQFGESGLVYRKNFNGFKKNPFSSQN
jgi:hypothetical protein